MFESIMPKYSALSLKIPSNVYRSQKTKLAPLNDTIIPSYRISYNHEIENTETHAFNCC